MNYASRYFILLMLALVFLSMPGCQYARLLQFKSQFQSFSRYFLFEISDSHIAPAVVCLSPVLKPDDILLLSHQTQPSRIDKNGTKTVWTYTMVKEKDPRKGLVISLIFNEKNKLEKAHYPIQFSTLFSPEAVPQFLIQMGNANVDVTAGALRGKRNREIPDSWIPNRAKVGAQLGVPTEEIPSKNTTLMIYRYEVLQPPPITQKIYTTIELTCRNKDQKIISFVSNVFGPEIGVGLVE